MAAIAFLVPTLVADHHVHHLVLHLVLALDLLQLNVIRFLEVDTCYLCGSPVAQQDGTAVAGHLLVLCRLYPLQQPRWWQDHWGPLPGWPEAG